MNNRDGIQWQCWQCTCQKGNYWRWETPFFGKEEDLRRSPAMFCNHCEKVNYIYIDVCEHKPGNVYVGACTEPSSLSQVISGENR